MNQVPRLDNLHVALAIGLAALSYDELSSELYWAKAQTIITITHGHDMA